MPDSSNMFEDEEFANLQLDEWAKTLKDSELSNGQIRVEGFSADVENGIDPVKLSEDRAIFIINELEKRGVSRSFFSEPIGHGATSKYTVISIPESFKENRRAILINNIDDTPVRNNEKVKKEIKLPDISGFLNKIKSFFSSIFNKLKSLFLSVFGKIKLFFALALDKFKYLISGIKKIISFLYNLLLMIILYLITVITMIITYLSILIMKIITFLYNILSHIKDFLIFLKNLLLEWFRSMGFGGGGGGGGKCISWFLFLLGLILFIIGFYTGILFLCIIGLILMILGGLFIILFFILKVLFFILLVLLAIAAIVYLIRFLGQIKFSFPTIRALKGTGMSYKKIKELSRQTGGTGKVKFGGKDDEEFRKMCKINENYVADLSEDGKWGNLVDPKRRPKLIRYFKKGKEGKRHLIVKNGFFKNPDDIAYRKASVREIGLKFFPNFRYSSGAQDSDPHGRGRPGTMELSNVLYANQSGLVKPKELKILKELSPQVYNRKGTPRCSDDTLNRFKSLTREIQSRIKNDAHSYLANNMQNHESDDMHTFYLVSGEFHSVQKGYSDWRKLAHTGGQSLIKASDYYD